MAFSSISFLFGFLPACLLCYFVIPARFRRGRNLVLLAFSLGLFVGTMLESGFVCFFLGVGLMGMGFWCIGKKY